MKLVLYVYIVVGPGLQRDLSCRIWITVDACSYWPLRLLSEAASARRFVLSVVVGHVLYTASLRCFPAASR